MKNNQEIQRIYNLLPPVSAVFKGKITPIIDERIEEHEPVIPAGTITYGGNVTAETMTAQLVAANQNKVYNLSENVTITDENKELFVEELTVGTVVKAGSNIIIVGISSEEATTYKFDLYSPQQEPILFVVSGPELQNPQQIKPNRIISWQAWGSFKIGEETHANCEISDFLLLKGSGEDKVKFENRPENFLPEGVTEVMVERINVWIVVQ